jgi:hypothetical protein
MATFSKNTLTFSSDGSPIPVTSIGVDLQTIHEGPHIPGLHELWIYACNPTNSDVMLTLLMGGNDFQTDTIFRGVIEAYAGNVLVIPGFIIKKDGGASGYSPGLNIFANVSVAGGVNLMGYVNQIS